MLTKRIGPEDAARLGSLGEHRGQPRRPVCDSRLRGLADCDSQREDSGNARHSDPYPTMVRANSGDGGD